MIALLAALSCQHWRMRLLLVGLIVGNLLAPRTADALCAMPRMHPAVLNDGVAAPDDGGLLVVTEIDHLPGNEGEAFQPDWRFKTAKTNEKPTLVTLAPGLVRYALPAKVAAAELHDGTQARGKITRATAALPALAAPKVAKIHHETFRTRRGNGAITTVVLDGAAPADVVALVVLDAKTGKPRSFGRATAGATEVTVYSQGRCSALPNGTVETRAGERVTLLWVDKHGRSSPATKPVTVARK